MAKTAASDAARWLQKVARMLERKGKAYGDSVRAPVGVFSGLSRREALRVRIDDKLARIKTGRKDHEDTLADLVGYLALLAVEP